MRCKIKYRLNERNGLKILAIFFAEFQTRISLALKSREALHTLRNPQSGREIANLSLIHI